MGLLDDEEEKRPVTSSTSSVFPNVDL